MIYQLNNETHWELSPAVMRVLVMMLTQQLQRAAGRSTGSTTLDIELANCRAALEAELQRLHPQTRRAYPYETHACGGIVCKVCAPPADNSDLI